MATERFCDESK